MIGTHELLRMEEISSFLNTKNQLIQALDTVCLYVVDFFAAGCKDVNHTVEGQKLMNQANCIYVIAYKYQLAVKEMSLVLGSTFDDYLCQTHESYGHMRRIRYKNGSTIVLRLEGHNTGLAYCLMYIILLQSNNYKCEKYYVH